MPTDPRDVDLSAQIKPLVLTLQIIVGAMIASLLCATGVFVWLRMGNQPPAAGGAQRLLPSLAVAFGVGAVVASRGLSSFIVRIGRSRIIAGLFEMPGGTPPALASLGDVGSLWMLYQTQAIVSSALLEGAAFFCLVSYFITGQQSLLGLVTAIVVILGLSFPSTRRVTDWIEGQLRLIAEERQFTRRDS